VFLPLKKVIEEDLKAKSKTPLGYQKKVETPKEEIENENEKYRHVVESFANKWFPLETLMKVKYFRINTVYILLKYYF
jgi:hypothetical protein